MNPFAAAIQVASSSDWILRAVIDALIHQHLRSKITEYTEGSLLKPSAGGFSIPTRKGIDGAAISNKDLGRAPRHDGDHPCGLPKK